MPVPVMCACVITGGSHAAQASPVQVNQRPLAWSKTKSGLLQSFANSAPQPVPPRTVPSSWIQPTT